MRLFLALTTLTILFGGCANSGKIPKSASIKFERTACYGSCPIYTFTLNGNGKAIFEGTRFTDKIGKYEKQFNAEETRSLFTLLNSIQWDTLKVDYPAYVSDLPSTIFEYHFKNTNKKVVVTGDHPEILNTFKTRLHNLASTDGWTLQTKK
ncbi:MAG: hypothetical protein GC181_15010 [Bacteroidetes bacterium]|nr:hypothetical protein [Bacteroidota bacterium]